MKVGTRTLSTDELINAALYYGSCDRRELARALGDDTDEGREANALADAFLRLRDKRVGRRRVSKSRDAAP